MVDKLQLPAGLTVNTITTVAVGSANLATLQTDLAANGNLTTALGALGNVAVVTIASGTAAGTYLVVATTAAAYSSSNSLIVRLQDAVNLDKLSTSNFVQTPSLTQATNTR